MAKKLVLVSGAQSTGNLHIGNYLGAVKNWVDLQESGKYDQYIFIADLHSLTGECGADERWEYIKVVAAELLAAGIDPDRTTFFVQSDVQEHCELAWIFSCVTPVSELYRMTQYKDKSTRQEKNINAGLLTYPILMAADILLYKGEIVPVGDDQVQHVELTRDIARWFNNRYGEYFPSTKHLLTETPRVMSILEPEKKMSKSLGAGHVIELADEPKVIEQKIKKAVTATVGGGDNPGVQNLLSLLKYFGDKKVYEKFVAAECDGSIRYGDLKKELTSAISGHFVDFRARRAGLLADEDKLNKILAEGAEKARKVAQKTMEEVRKMVGLK